MKNLIDQIYEMKEAVAFEIGEANKRIAQSGGKLSKEDLDIVDKLSHAMKSLVTTCAMLEAEEEGYSSDYMPMGQSYRGGYSGRERREGYSGEGYSGRGRYSREGREGRNSYGYSRAGDMNERLHQMMDEAPDENTRMVIRKLMERM